MTGLEPSDVVRIAVLAGFVGLAVFFASYAFAVWLRRNKRSRSQRSFLQKAGLAAILMAIVGGVISWGVSTFTPRAGVVDGNDLFVVHRRSDAGVLTLIHRGPVSAGTVLAELRPPAIEAQLAIVDNQMKEAHARVEVLEARALPLDPVLLQKQAQLRAQLDQHRHFHFELQRSAREFERDQLSLLTAWTREKAQIKAELATSEKHIEAAASQLGIARAALDRMTGLHRRHIVSVQHVDDRTNAILGLELEQNRHQVAISELRQRSLLLDERYETANASFIHHLNALQAQAEGVSANLAALEAEYQQVQKFLKSDAARAERLARREIAAAHIQIATLEAERRKIVDGTLVKAPFDGHIVYRHPSPGFAPENAPVLAMAAGSGFAARVLISDQEADQVMNAGGVNFAIESPVILRHFTGTFREFETTSEPGKRLAIFDVSLPVETIAALGAGRDVKVRLIWQPKLYLNPAFQGSLMLAALGFLCLCLGRKKNRALIPEHLPQVHILNSRAA